MATSISCLVSYSDSNTDESSGDEDDNSNEELTNKNKKRRLSNGGKSNSESTQEKLAKVGPSIKDRLPVPDGITSMFLDKEEEHLNLADQHDGRIRSFAHEKGNWASLVFAPIQEENILQLALKLMQVMSHLVQFKLVDDLHLSLSKTFVIRHHWIDSLVTSLRSNLGSCRSCICGLGSPKIYVNDEKTRTFLGIQVNSNISELKRFVEETDKSLEEFRLPVYYKDPSFHVSLAWAVGDVTEKLDKDILEDLRTATLEFFSDCSSDNCIKIQLLKLKTGNKLFYIPLADT